MREVIRLLVLVLLVGVQAANTSAAENDELVEHLYIIEFTTGPAWVADKPFHEQAHAADHSANLRRLREQGSLILGARHGATGMIVLRAVSEVAARSEIDQDPAVGAGVFSYTIEEFKPFFGGCVETADLRFTRERQIVLFNVVGHRRIGRSMARAGGHRLLTRPA